MGGLKASRTVVGSMLALTLVACGGDGDESGSSKREWQAEHRDLVAAFGRDLDATTMTLNQGEKTATLSACTQLADDAKEMRDEVFPVSNKQVERPLRQSVDLALMASDNCLKGGRDPGGARQVEEAMRQVADARRAFQEAEGAISDWR
ncbi:MAG: hypothetical protein LC733_09190 [Actinobacteria bacterium]|nr:hypothetical protein [Actinomycetota bacterium]